nr:uncharacterized protein LOC107447197 [Parasteatoda tepidariorum]
MEAQQWESFSTALPSINNISIKRCILIENPVHIDLHGFTDASESAYGFVIYCKSYSDDGTFEMNLICGKSRISPLKRVTVPRWELCAAFLLVRLITKVKSALQFESTDIFLWSDSMIVLSWIRKEPFHLKTYIANRVASIQDLTQVQQWRHVSSENNLADIISRGMNPEKLIGNKL